MLPDINGKFSLTSQTFWLHREGDEKFQHVIARAIGSVCLFRGNFEIILISVRLAVGVSMVHVLTVEERKKERKK